MPFKSEAQRRYMHKFHPEIAKRWEKQYGSSPVKAAIKKRIRKPRPRGT